MNFSRASLSLIGFLCLGVSMVLGQPSFPDARPFSEIKGPKAAVSLSDADTDEIAFTPDSRYLVSRSGKTFTVWDVRNRKKESEWNLENGISSFALSPDGKTIAVSRRMSIALYDFATRKKIRSWVVPAGVPEREETRQVVFNDDGTLLAAATGVFNHGVKPNGSIYVWELADKGDKPRYAVKDVLNYQMSPPVIAFLPGEKQLLSSGGGYGSGFGEGAESLLFDLESGKTRPLASYQGRPERVGSRFAVTGDGSLWVLGETAWASGKSTRVGLFLPHSDLGVFGLTFCPKGRSLAAIGATHDENNSNLAVWDVVRADERVQFKERVWIAKLPGVPRRLAFSPNGSFLAVATTKSLLLWDAKALLPVTDPVLLNEDLLHEIDLLCEQVQTLERRLKELESKKP